MLQRVWLFYTVKKLKWYIETSRPLTFCLIRYGLWFVVYQYKGRQISWRYFCLNMFNCERQNYGAKLSDFGLAKDGPQGSKSHVSTRVMGTYGYAAPEYMATGIYWSPVHMSMRSQAYHVISMRWCKFSNWQLRGIWVRVVRFLPSCIFPHLRHSSCNFKFFLFLLVSHILSMFKSCISISLCFEFRLLRTASTSYTSHYWMMLWFLKGI